MREWSRELLAAPDPVAAARARCATLSRLTGVPGQPVWEWGFMERVSTGLLLLSLGREQEGRLMLDVAEVIAGADAV
jgi:streptomycin 6-kinase